MPRQFSDQQIADALRASLGKVCLAAERLGCPHALIYERARSSEKVAEVIRFFRGKLLDAAESALWKGVLEGEMWAVRLTLDQWGSSRDFSDGAESWHSPCPAEDLRSSGSFNSLLGSLLTEPAYVEYQRTCAQGADSGDLRGTDQPRPLEAGAAPAGDRPGDHRHDPGKDRADPGD